MPKPPRGRRDGERRQTWQVAHEAQGKAAGLTLGLGLLATVPEHVVLRRGRPPRAEIGDQLLLRRESCAQPPHQGSLAT